MSYGFKLAFVSLAAFFFVNLATAAAASWLAPAAIRSAGRMRARSAARLLLILRLAPTASALCIVATLCIPSYLRFEPDYSAESVGAVCLIAAILCMTAGGASLIRAARAIARSRRAKDLRVGLAGVIHPRVIVSKEVQSLLSAEELDVALRHESAHAASRDNLKRLFILLTPDALPCFPGLASLECAWKKFAEWAADDDAVNGDPKRAVALASALVSVARLGPPARYALVTSLTEDNLAGRIGRLLAPEAKADPGHWTAAVGTAGVIALLTATLWPGGLPIVYAVLERLIQ